MEWCMIIHIICREENEPPFEEMECVWMIINFGNPILCLNPLLCFGITDMDQLFIYVAQNCAVWWIWEK